MLLEELLNNEEVLARLDKAESEEEFCAILSEQGLSAEEIAMIVDKLRDPGEELSEEDLENVSAAGNPHLQKIIYRWAYRFKHKKLFVKATYDEDSRTITVCNRFGKEKVCETNFY